jgi:hypothetical protein
VREILSKKGNTMIVTLAIITGILSAFALFLIGQLVAHIVSETVIWIKGFKNHGKNYYHMRAVERIKELNAQGIAVKGQRENYGISYKNINW